MDFIDNNKISITMFLHKKNSFDNVCHERLLLKIENYKIRISTLNLV